MRLGLLPVSGGLVAVCRHLGLCVPRGQASVSGWSVTPPVGRRPAALRPDSCRRRAQSRLCLGPAISSQRWLAIPGIGTPCSLAQPSHSPVANRS